MDLHDRCGFPKTKCKAEVASFKAPTVLKTMQIPDAQLETDWFANDPHSKYPKIQGPPSLGCKGNMLPYPLLVYFVSSFAHA